VDVTVSTHIVGRTPWWFVPGLQWAGKVSKEAVINKGEES
jgi:hypothetical protein